MSWENDPTVVRWARHVIEEQVPGMDNSKVCLSLFPGPNKDHTIGDVKYWVELGYMLCADKPLMLVVMGDEKVPEHLERAADDIVRLPEGATPWESKYLAMRIQAFVEKHPE